MSSVFVLLAVLSGLLPMILIVVLVVYVVRASNGQNRRVPPVTGHPAVHPTAAPPTVPLSPATVAQVTALVRQGQKIHAIKLVREATGLGLKEAKDRVDGWSEVVELQAAQAASAPPTPGTVPTGTTVPHDERLRIEASAIVATSGWHTAEAFLREQRGLTPEAAKALLDSLE